MNQRHKFSTIYAHSIRRDCCDIGKNLQGAFCVRMLYANGTFVSAGLDVQNVRRVFPKSINSFRGQMDH